MCGLIGIAAADNAAERIHAGLSFLQHRGQDAAGIAAMSGDRVFMDKGLGIAEDVFTEDRLVNLRGDFGIGHVRYSTAGSSRAPSEIQPFYVNHPYGIALAHNGNLVNAGELRRWLSETARRHVGTESDSEALLNVLAGAFSSIAGDGRPMADRLFDAVAEVHRRCVGAYSVVALVAGVGLLAFRDPLGIRPLTVGGDGAGNWLVASEDVAFRPLGFPPPRDIAPGEAVFIDENRQAHRRQCAPNPGSRPCAFEYIYLARPDSALDGASVYQARLNMGRNLARKIRRDFPDLPIDCVVPVPDSGRVAAMELAHSLSIPYREGLVKNRHIGRAFISAGRQKRDRAARKKLNVIAAEFAGKHALLVDDSIVRGTTGRELVSLVRAAGAKSVIFASAAPPVRRPNVYGIDIPTRAELVAGFRDESAIARYLGADRVIFQSLPDLLAAIREANPALSEFETSCFDGDYPVGDIGEEYLASLAAARGEDRENAFAQGDLPLA